jgi:hypothetical protein
VVKIPMEYLLISNYLCEHCNEYVTVTATSRKYYEDKKRSALLKGLAYSVISLLVFAYNGFLGLVGFIITIFVVSGQLSYNEIKLTGGHVRLTEKEIREKFTPTPFPKEPVKLDWKLNQPDRTSTRTQHLAHAKRLYRPENFHGPYELIRRLPISSISITYPVRNMAYATKIAPETRSFADLDEALSF